MCFRGCQPNTEVSASYETGAAPVKQRATYSSFPQAPAPTVVQGQLVLLPFGCCE